MALFELDRKLLVVPITVFAQDVLAARSEAAAEAAASFIVPSNGVIRGLQASLTLLSGTTKTWVVSLANSVPTTLVTLTALTDVILQQRTKGLALKVTEGQVLTIN